MRVVVVGAGLAGIRSAETLREQGFDGELVLIGDEPHVPYTRPPLSKQVLAGTWEEDRVWLRSAEEINELRLDLRLGVQAQSLDLGNRSLALSDGSSLAFDGLVIATGARARALPELHGRPGVFSLRTLDDTRALGIALAEAESVVVIGGGFIGAEVAATAADLGKQVSTVEPQETMLIRGLGPSLGRAIERLHRDNGVDVRAGITIDSVDDDGTITTLALSDGTELRGDVIVLGVGAVPNVEWLDSSSVCIDDGVVCDGYCRVVSQEGEPLTGIVAAGDVARWMCQSQGSAVRVEHWTNAQEQAKATAETLMFDIGAREQEPSLYDPTPYLWSDQFGKKIQVVGYLDGSETPHVVKGDDLTPPFLALMERDGRVVGAVGVAMVPALVKARAFVESGASLEEAIDAFAEQ